MHVHVTEMIPYQLQLITEVVPPDNIASLHFCGGGPQQFSLVRMNKLHVVLESGKVAIKVLTVELL